MHEGSINSSTLWYDLRQRQGECIEGTGVLMGKDTGGTWCSLLGGGLRERSCPGRLAAAPAPDPGELGGVACVWRGPYELKV